jgi:Cellulose biosynthesis protein BcsS
MCALMMLPIVSATAAEKKPLTWRDVWKWREVWTGVDASRDEWLVYSGVTVAPFGHIHEEGWRVRLAGGYGGYKYSGDRSIDATPDIQRFEAKTYYTDVLAGYLARWGPLTAKAFAGVSFIGHNITPFDTENIAVGDEIGAKGVIELWLNIGTNAYASLDLGWSSAHNTRSARSRIGFRVTPTLSIGVEDGINLDAQGDCDLGWSTATECDGQNHIDSGKTGLFDYSRGGVFVRYEWDGGEISASGGVAGGIIGSSERDGPDPYVTINYITQW